jgi:hypothetical protein
MAKPLFDAKNGVVVILFIRNKETFSVPQGIEITGLWIRILGRSGRTPDPGFRTSLRQRSIRIISVTKQEMVERAVWVSRIHRLIREVMLIGNLGDISSILLNSQLSQFQRGRQAASQSVTIIDSFIMGHRSRHSIRIVSWLRFVLRWGFSKLFQLRFDSPLQVQTFLHCFAHRFFCPSTERQQQNEGYRLHRQQFAI